MCYGITIDKERIDDAVQELFLYLMQMNPNVLKSIYEKDGTDGIIRYGAVVLKRALTSKRSPFYYKYEKYYTHIDSASYSSSTTFSRDDDTYNIANNKNIANIPNQEKSEQWKKLEKVDQVLDSLDSWYDRELFKLYYYEGNTLDSLAAKTKISRNSLFTTIDKVRTILKKELIDE
tara:strand:- start:17 stop:544 length:528 start_codon:yes stop_codon:yes gene_type:complete